jgi:NFU1 iron-sulfur cluster scaffold homolog, mitochondrial
MSLLKRIRGVLGIPEPLEVQIELPPLVVGAGARDRLAALPSGQGVHVETRPARRGRIVVVTEGEALGPPPPALEPLPISIGDADLALLRGRTLDHADGRWVVRVHLDLRGQDTPNPDSRLYLSNHVLARGRPAFFSADREGDRPDLAERLLEIPGVRTALLRENAVTIERAPGAPWPELDAAVDAALREHLLACGEAVEATRWSQGSDPLEEQIRAALAERVIPAIHRDGGDLELVGVADGVVRVALVGACRTCPSSTATLRLGIERTLKEMFPGQVERVEPV